MTTPYSYPWQCLICGEEFIARVGKLHHCPGDRLSGFPARDFEPLPSAMCRIGRSLREKRERACLNVMLGINP
jgi:hypothetical protein